MDTQNQRAKVVPGLLLTALFKDAATAESAYLDAIKLGHKSEHISAFLSEETKNKNFSRANSDADHIMPTNVVSGMGVGGAIGSAIGALAGIVMAAGTALTLPGLGLIVSGPLVVGLAGAGAGGLAGSLVGILVEAGVSEKEASKYELGIKEGGVVLGVQTFSEVEYQALKKEWQKY